MRTTHALDAALKKAEAEGRVRVTGNGNVHADYRPTVMFWLPIPPSTNHLFRSGIGGRYKTKQYRAWQKNCAAILRFEHDAKPFQWLPCDVSIMVLGGDGFPRGRDIDNIIKPVLDLLVKAGVLPGDNVTRVRSVVARYVDRDHPECPMPAVFMVSIQGDENYKPATDLPPPPAGA